MLLAGEGANTLIGGEGHDVLDGGANDDILYGEYAFNSQIYFQPLHSCHQGAIPCATSSTEGREMTHLMEGMVMTF